jgi:hypothetical protein
MRTRRYFQPSIDGLPSRLAPSAVTFAIHHLAPVAVLVGNHGHVAVTAPMAAMHAHVVPRGASCAQDPTDPGVIAPKIGTPVSDPTSPGTAPPSAVSNPIIIAPANTTPTTMIC